MRKIVVFSTVLVIVLATAIFALYLGRKQLTPGAYLFYPKSGQVEVLDTKEELILRRREHYQEMTKAIDDAWSNIQIGNLHYKLGNYQEAAAAYEQAYSIGEKAVSGFKLAQTYEKLNRHDDAINLLNQMAEKHQLSALGVQDAEAMKSRLLAAKAAAANAPE